MILSLNDGWQIRWSTGQRGGSPYVYRHPDGSDNANEYRGLPRRLTGRYQPGGWIDARVPGEVHLDLIRAGLLDDPRDGTNVLKARWVEETVWYYRRVFTPPQQALEGVAYLVFEELDLSAIVYLNGEEIARHENAFYPLCVSVAGLLLPGENELVVRLDSGLFNVCEKPIKKYDWASHDVGVLLTKRHWLRKPQYETEWDWSPRLLNVGISGNVELRYDPAAVVEHWQVRSQVSTNKQVAELTARILPAEGADPAADYRLEMTVDGQTVFAEGAVDSLSVRATVNHPRLWYPVGYGEQSLYPVYLRLTKNGRVIWEKETETGFRLVELDQSVHPEKGHYFILSVNGRRVFAKGGNLVPASLFPAEVTEEDYNAITDRALEANFNILRIWGGGLYEKEALYRLCDRKGILLWQEFLSACAYPPCGDDEQLHTDMLREARYQVRRLSRHPSLIVWCGNNEVSPWDRPLYMEDYPCVLREEDPEKLYQPASPYTDNVLSNVPQNHAWWEFAGDQHPWSVGFANKDHREYRQMVCRFPNEGGVLGPVNRPTMTRITDGKGDYLHSLAFEMHDNTLHYLNEFTSPDRVLRFWTGVGPESLSLEEYIAAGGYVQGEGLSEYIDNFRRRAFSSSSAIFWMFNDCWPASRSWTILDDAHRRNPAFYHVKRAFAPLRLVLSEADGNVTVWGVYEGDDPLAAMLEYGVFRSDGDVTGSHTVPVTLAPRSVTKLAELPQAAFAKDAPGGSLPVPYALLRDQKGNLLSRNRFLSHRYHAYTLADAPRITVTRNRNETVFISDRFVMGVCLDLDGIDRLSDNLFDLYPGMPYRVRTAGHDTVLFTLNRLLAEHR